MEIFTLLETIEDMLEKGKNVLPLKPKRLVKDWKETVIAMADMAKEM